MKRQLQRELLEKEVTAVMDVVKKESEKKGAPQKLPEWPRTLHDPMTAEEVMQVERCKLARGVISSNVDVTGGSRSDDVTASEDELERVRRANEMLARKRSMNYVHPNLTVKRDTVSDGQCVLCEDVIFQYDDHAMFRPCEHTYHTQCALKMMVRYGIARFRGAIICQRCEHLGGWARRLGEKKVSTVANDGSELLMPCEQDRRHQQSYAGQQQRDPKKFAQYPEVVVAAPRSDSCTNSNNSSGKRRKTEGGARGALGPQSSPASDFGYGPSPCFTHIQSQYACMLYVFLVLALAI